MSTAQTQTYYVTRLAGPRVAGKRASKGDALSLTERQARAELLAGAITLDKALIDDPWGEAAKAEAAKVAADKAAADAKAAAEKATVETQAAETKAAGDPKGAAAGKSAAGMGTSPNPV